VCFASTVETVNADALYVQWCIIHDVFSGAELGEKVQNMEGTEQTVRVFRDVMSLHRTSTVKLYNNW